ncbi:hypothetical protein BH160DRAFT_6972, partial [Burkholderia sp. H160]
MLVAIAAALVLLGVLLLRLWLRTRLLHRLGPWFGARLLHLRT